MAIPHEHPAIPTLALTGMKLAQTWNISIANPPAKEKRETLRDSMQKFVSTRQLSVEVGLSHRQYL